MSSKMKLEAKIRAVLASDEQSRNSDIRLTQMIWWRYHQDLVTTFNGKAYIRFDDLFELPREDNIKRIRAKIQNDLKEYLPTDPVIAKKRGWAEDEWRSYLGYKTSEEVKDEIAGKAISWLND